MDYWSSLLTEKSWKILQEINKRHNFILIGGWAAYLWTKQQKSKDIDIVVDINELQKFKSEDLRKNNALKKYEIKNEEIDIDIYVEYFSKLALPVEEIKNYKTKIEGFSVISKEALLVLKQGAFEERKNSIKGEKDKIDILSLIFLTDINLKEYVKILSKYSLKKYLDDLISLIKAFQDYNSLQMTPRELKIKKKDVLDRAKRL